MALGSLLKTRSGFTNAFGRGGSTNTNSSTATVDPKLNPFVNLQTAGGQGLVFDPKTGQLKETETGFGEQLRKGAEQYTGELMAGTQGAEDKAYDLLMARQQPMFKQQQTDFERMMAKRGIPAGAMQFGKGLQDLSKAQSSASQEAALAAMEEGRSRQESQRANIAQLLSGRSELVNPMVQMAGISENPLYTAYREDLMAQQAASEAKKAAKRASKDQLIGGAIGGASSLGAGFLSGGGGKGLFSDKRLKEDIKEVGKLFDGTPVYVFKYKQMNGIDDPAYHMGVMAQEIEETHGDCVVEHEGYKLVNYKKLCEEVINMEKNNGDEIYE